MISGKRGAVNPAVRPAMNSSMSVQSTKQMIRIEFRKRNSQTPLLSHMPLKQTTVPLPFVLYLFYYMA